MSYQNRSGQNGREEGKEERGDHDNKKDNFAEAPTTGRNPKRGVRGAKEGKSREGADEGTEREREAHKSPNGADGQTEGAKRTGGSAVTQRGGRKDTSRAWQKNFQWRERGGNGKARRGRNSNTPRLPACLPAKLAGPVRLSLESGLQLRLEIDADEKLL